MKPPEEERTMKDSVITGVGVVGAVLFFLLIQSLAWWMGWFDLLPI